MAATFLTAEWRKLIMANYPVAPELLAPWLPAGTVLDPWQGQTYVSLVGFLFQNTRIKSIAVPFHRTFEEVNLRFYVLYTTPSGERRRGVVFISELVPRLALTVVANTIYGENYRTLPLQHDWTETDVERTVAYRWRCRRRWNELRVTATLAAEPITPGSSDEFFTEHYWGYTRRSSRTSEYAVLHPRWFAYPVLNYAIDVDFGGLYGSSFASLANQSPASILLAEGSPIEVRAGTRI
jgi:uncharacterized protein YqjF (DUF2071 family)